MTIPRNRVRVTSARVHGVLLHYWHCPSCDQVSCGYLSWLIIGTSAHRHARATLPLRSRLRHPAAIVNP